MSAMLINEELNRLPEGDSHPYRTGPWQPNMCEYDDLDPVLKDRFEPERHLYS